jgi:hypothetical protein
MPAIVVGVQGMRKGDTDPEWHDWGPGRNWETATAKELVSVVDRRYRTLPTREARALIGISAGGYDAALIGIHRASVYSVIESWSGYFYATDPAGTGPMDVGSEEADDLANANTLVPELKTASARFKPTLFGFYIGTDDKLFLAENRTFARELTAAHVEHAYVEYRGGHNASFLEGTRDGVGHERAREPRATADPQPTEYARWCERGGRMVGRHQVSGHPALPSQESTSRRHGCRYPRRYCKCQALDTRIRVCSGNC